MCLATWVRLFTAAGPKSQKMLDSPVLVCFASHLIWTRLNSEYLMSLYILCEATQQQHSTHCRAGFHLREALPDSHRLTSFQMNASSIPVKILYELHQTQSTICASVIIAYPTVLTLRAQVQAR
ncbi:hypothetical protein EDD17DRAFT_1588984 [Pisolithus thermaeus]|nr:hypothetical protein EDD17DRAFT_1588984 [Pisolithus thermaeus]